MATKPEGEWEVPDEDAPWSEPSDPDSPHPWISSATDLLISWFPDTGSEAMPAVRPSPQKTWDEYFGSPSPPPHSEALAEQTWEREVWEPDAAESAVDCLFRFIHALELGDLAGVMACIHPDYHVVEDGREIDREVLRMDLERLLDQWRGNHAHITLTEVPDPVFHPAGILILTTIQMDFPVVARQGITSQLLGRLFVFTATPSREWLISSIARVDRTAG